jgi:hypothetical protein
LTKSRGIGRGGPRPNSGRPRGKQSASTVARIAAINRAGGTGDDMRPSQFLAEVMRDESAPLAARIVCAAKVMAFVEPRPPQPEINEIPLMRHWSSEQFDSFLRRTAADMAEHPEFYEMLPPPPSRRVQSRDRGQSGACPLSPAAEVTSGRVPHIVSTSFVGDGDAQVQMVGRTQ